MPPLLRQPTVAGGQTWWTTGYWECLPPSSPYCNSLDYFMWCVFEREVSKCPHITLTSLKVMTSAVVTDLDREVIIHTSMKFQSWIIFFWIEVVMEATGVFIKKMFILYAYKLFLKFSSEYIHPNYFFYCFECCHRVCPNLSSAPCMFACIIFLT